MTHYFDVADRKECPLNHAETHEITWATQTIKLGSDRVGVKPAGVDGTHINCVAVSPDGKHIVTADDFGLVNVFNYPAETHESKSRSYSAHSEHVVRIAFSKDGQRLFSVGGQDKTLIQWRIKPQ